MADRPALSLDTSPTFDGHEDDPLEHLRDWVRSHRVEEIECAIGDMHGIARGKVMPSPKFLKEAGVNLPTSTFFTTIDGDWAEDVGTALYTDPDLRLVPDIATARAVPWANDRSLQVIHDAYHASGEPFELAPRYVLRRVIDLYAQQGWYPVVAPEIEFYLTKPNTDPEERLEPPIGRSGRQSRGNQGYSLSSVDEYDSFIELIYDYADAQGLEIDTVIQESGPAQLEINMLHGDALALADQVFLFKRLIREAALRTGTHATFMAKPYGDTAGSAMHIHTSVTDKAGASIFSDPETGAETEAFRSFIGGQQTYFYAATALVAPYVNSYRRLSGGYSAPINLDWGVDNRTAGLRVPRSDPAARRVENRVAGADANPYLAVAATLAAGYLGLVQGITPRPTFEGNSYTAKPDLPLTLLDALAALEASSELRQVFGEKFVDTFCTVKRAEHDEFMKVISPWEREHLLLNV